jgi:hypothetical protein
MLDWVASLFAAPNAMILKASYSSFKQLVETLIFARIALCDNIAS